MNTDELSSLLDRLIADWESEVVEFKRGREGFSMSEIGKYFSALANEANLRLMYVGGGETQIDGVDQNNESGTVSALATWRHTFSPHWQLLSQVGTDLAVENGFREAARVQFRILKVF